MEVLLKGKLILVSMLMVGFFSGTAQDFSEVQEAFSQSYVLENQGEYQKAINMLRQIYDEKSYEINLRLGWLYYSAGQHTSSQQHYDRSIRLRPLAIEARFGAVLPETALGNMEQVLKHYQAIIRIDPNNTFANYSLGLIYYNRKDYAAAYKCFEIVANLYPFDYDAIHMFAWVNYQLKKTREARVLFQKALLIRPGDSSSLEGLERVK